MHHFFGYEIAVLITLLSQAFTPWTQVWWTGIAIAAIVAVISGIHTLWSLYGGWGWTVLSVARLAIRIFLSILALAVIIFAIISSMYLWHKLKSTEYTLFFTCDKAQLPAIMPASGAIHLLPLGYSGGGQPVTLGVGPQTKTGIPGEPLRLLPEETDSQALKCSLINYSKVPVFNITTAIKMEEFESVVSATKPGQGISEGRLINTVMWPLHVEQLGAESPHDVYDIYMFNGGENIIRVWNPAEARVQAYGSDRLTDIKLQPAMLAAQSLGPARDVRK